MVSFGYVAPDPGGLYHPRYAVIDNETIKINKIAPENKVTIQNFGLLFSLNGSAYTFTGSRNTLPKVDTSISGAKAWLTSEDGKTASKIVQSVYVK